MVWSQKDFSVIPSIYEYNIIYINISKVPFLHPNISPQNTITILLTHWLPQTIKDSPRISLVNPF